MTALREGLPPLPPRMQQLPIDARGYPIPWFVHTLPDGSRDFRIADGDKRRRAARNRLCWICGQRLGRHLAFVIGPMCAVNRNTSEPPSHLECAQFAATACPFLTLPRAQYRTANLPGEHHQLPHALGGNPGACAIWITQSFKPYYVPGGENWLIEIGPPDRVLWYCTGRVATRAEIVACLDERLPILASVAQAEGVAALDALTRAINQLLPLLPDGDEMPSILADAPA